MKNQHIETTMIGRESEKHENYFVKLFNRQIDFFEQNRFGMMAMYIIAQSCLGSIACMYILKEDTGYVMLALCVAVTMGANSFFIAQSGAKLCIIMTYVSVIVNTLLIFLV